MPTPIQILAVLALIVVAVFSLRGLRIVRVNEWQRAAVYIDGVFDVLLAPGRHALWRPWGRVIVTHVDLTPQHQTVGPVEAVTADKLPLRLTATIVTRIEDVARALREPAWAEINLVASAALTRLAAPRTLDQLMARDESLDAALAEALGPRIGAVTVEKAVVTGVILPPELRRLMSEVERSRLEGLAALERARAEQSSLRALANAARLLKDNPELAQLRLLQTVAAAKGATVVLGDMTAATRK